MGAFSLTLAMVLIVVVQILELCGYGWLALWSTDADNRSCTGVASDNDTCIAEKDADQRYYRIGMYGAIGFSQGY